MATWQMLKREKMVNQAKQRALGSYKRLSPGIMAHGELLEITKPVARDGKAQRLPEATRPTTADYRAMKWLDGVVVQRLEAGKAAGLREDVGAMGKGKRVAFRSCGGDGTRIKQGLTPESYTYVTELVSNRS